MQNTFKVKKLNNSVEKKKANGVSKNIKNKKYKKFDIVNIVIINSSELSRLAKRYSEAFLLLSQLSLVCLMEMVLPKF